MIREIDSFHHSWGRLLTVPERAGEENGEEMTFC